MAQDETKEITNVANDMFNDMHFERRDPRTVSAHSLNWKSHPSFQREAYNDFQADVGWAGALLYNEQTGRLLDGHMRLQDALERNLKEVPVLIISVDEEKELKILRYLDELGVLFHKRQSAIDLLEQQIEKRSGLMDLISAGEVPHEQSEDEDEDDVKLSVDLPEGGLSLVPGEEYNYIVLLFQTEMSWVSAQDFFGLQRVKCVFNTGIGVGRVIDGDEAMELIYQARVSAMKTPEGDSAVSIKDRKKSSADILAARRRSTKGGKK